MTRPILIPALCILALVAGCTTTGTAEGQRTEQADAAGENGKPVDGEEEAGGYSRIETGHRRAVAAYAVLQRELASRHPEIELGAAREAFMRVVDGFNVRLVCVYRRTGGGPDADRTLEAVVYLSARSGSADRLVSLDLATEP